ncbi:MAG: threonine synthase, partial [Bdellovibrionales bacterium]|nr:threonine synthase [Bdellovibrionales bacterium]
EMKFASTRNPGRGVDLSLAVMQGLAPDGGLFMPQEFPLLTERDLASLRKSSFAECAERVLSPFLVDSFSKDEISSLCADAFCFDCPVIELEDSLYALELFHGPTLAFKDFGARFMARIMARMVAETAARATVLVATSGDTGGAVADGFYQVPGIDVIVLYPKGRVSERQEAQFTTLGENVHAFAIDGSFDDCQRLVKESFLDSHFRAEWGLTSANSINIARLLPQSTYYFWAWSRLPGNSQPPIFSVPSGNFGNLTAGLFAQRMGLPVRRFIASTNVNDVVPEFLLGGKFSPRPSLQTISNAMDVGNPSNFERMLALFNGDETLLRSALLGKSFPDEKTENAIGELYQKYRYVADPHSAVAYLGIRDCFAPELSPKIFLCTAHPSKFPEVTEKVLRQRIDIPRSLQTRLEGPKVVSDCSSDLKTFRQRVEGVLERKG